MGYWKQNSQHMRKTKNYEDDKGKPTTESQMWKTIDRISVTRKTYSWGPRDQNLCYLHNTFSKEGMQKWTGPRICITTQTIKFLLLPSSPIISVKKFHFEWKDQKKKSLFCWVFQHLVNIIALRYVFTVPRPKHENFPIDNLQWGFIIHLLGFPGGSRQWRICLQFRRSGFNSWVGKIP